MLIVWSDIPMLKIFECDDYVKALYKSDEQSGLFMGTSSWEVMTLSHEVVGEFDSSYHDLPDWYAEADQLGFVRDEF